MTVLPATMPGAAHRLLILGGTGEAADLAGAIQSRFGARIRIVTSLAGRTEHPRAVSGERRIGGFGGSQELSRYLREGGFDFVIDATHPFAAKISASAREACDAARVPRLILTRPPWQRDPKDRWFEVADAQSAAKLIPDLGKRVFVTVGRRALAPFAGLAGCWFLIRLVEPPKDPIPLPNNRYELIVARGPFAVGDERALMERYRIDVLVAKASGGGATEAKLLAARELGLPVILLSRPAPEPGEIAENIGQALDWLTGMLERLDETPAART